MRSLLLVSLLTTLFHLPLISADGKVDGKISNGTSLENLSETLLAKGNEMTEGEWSRLNGMMKMMQMMMIKDANNSSDLETSMDHLGEGRHRRQIVRAMMHPDHEKLDRHLFVADIWNRVMVIGVCVSVLFLIGMFIGCRLFIVYHFNGWDNSRKEKFIKRWPRLFNQLTKMPFTFIPAFYTEAQMVHSANCQLCNGKKDAYRCRASTVRTERRREEDVVVEEEKVDDPPLVENGGEGGVIKGAARRLGIPYLS